VPLASQQDNPTQFDKSLTKPPAQIRHTNPRHTAAELAFWGGGSARKPALLTSRSRLEPRPTCVGAPADAEVPAGGDVHGLGEVAAVAVRRAAPPLEQGARPRRPAAAAAGYQSQLALLQIHILVDQYHLAHSRVIAGHVGLSDVGQDNGRVIQESHFSSAAGKWPIASGGLSLSPDPLARGSLSLSLSFQSLSEAGEKWRAVIFSISRLFLQERCRHLFGEQ